MKKIVFCCVVLLLSQVVMSAPDIVKVKGVGTGETEEAALKDAYRDAVESAVGMYVDAEQAAKNDEIIKDEILTQSNAYIEDYDEIEKKKENGLVKIKILARVKRQEITKRISGTMKAKSFKVGGGLKNLHAQMTTTERKSGDGAALLAQALEGVDPLRQLMEVSLATGEAVQVKEQQRGPRANASDDGMVTLAYLFKFEINRDRYFKEFLPNLERVLTQVSDVEPREIVITAKDYPEQSEERRRCNLYVEAGDSRGLSMGMKIHQHEGAIGGRKAISSSAFGEMRCAASFSVNDRDKPLDVVVVTESNEAMTAIRGKTFSLDAASASVVADFCDGKLAATAGAQTLRGRSRRMGGGACQIAYNVLFLDAQGKTLAAHQITSRDIAYNVKNELSCEAAVSVSPRWRGTTEMRNDRFWFVTPFIGCNAMAYYKWCSFKIAKDDLPKIDSIKIELAK